MGQGKLDCYALGQRGVNLVKNPLQLDRDEATQLQNTIWTATQGGLGLGKRGGLTRLNSVAMNSGASVLSASSVPLPNPFNTSTLVRKYLYAAGLSGWYRSADGTTWSSFLSSPQLGGRYSQSGIGILGIPPVQPVAGRMLYVDGNLGLDDLYIWDNTADQLLLFVPPISPGTTAYSAGASGYHQGDFYFGTNDSPNGRVYKLDPVTGQLTMIAGGVIGTNYTCFSIYSYIGQLFIGASDNAPAAPPTSFIYRCDPASATAWTVDSAALLGVPDSMVNFLGNLYIGCGSRDAATSMNVYKRTPSGVYSAVLTDANPWDVTAGTILAVHAGKILAYQAGKIYSSSNGTAWASEIDVFATYTSFAGRPGRPVEFGGSLYWPFEDTAGTGSGRILKRTSGAVWSSVFGPTDLLGLLTVLELP